jgi:hypothetical protein
MTQIMRSKSLSFAAKAQCLAAGCFALGVLSLGACSNGSTSTTSSTPPPKTPKFAMTALPVPAGGTEVSLPPFGGFSGDFIAPSNNAGAGTVLVLTSYSAQPKSAPQPLAFRRRAMLVSIPDTVVLSGSKAIFWESLGTNIAFNFNAFPALSIAMPSTTNTTNVTFYLETINGTLNTLLDQEVASSVNGTVVDFPGAAGTFGLTPGFTYWWEVISATPTPSPSPTASA